MRAAFVRGVIRFASGGSDQAPWPKDTELSPEGRLVRDAWERGWDWAQIAKGKGMGHMLGGVIKAAPRAQLDKWIAGEQP